MKKTGTLRNSEFSELTDVLKNRLKKIFGGHLNKIILYGSYAVNEEEIDSDIDIMVLTDISKSELVQYRDIISELMVDLSLDYGKLVSITESNIDDFRSYSEYIPFYRNISRKGIELYAS